jgi:pimeloyl-ACP methyl ester carboxylesterase
VQDRLPPRVRSCAYDRAGLGRSEPGPLPRTMAQEVFELHALVEAARIRGPLVLVGHSIGGLLVRLYASRHAADVAGVVLVDATHESSVLFNLKLNRWVRIRELATPRAVPAPRHAAGGDGQAGDYLAEELQQIYQSRQSNPQPLGDRPLIVLAAGRESIPPGTSEELWNQLREEKREQKLDLAKLSSNAKFVRDPSSGHEIQRDNPALVAGAIEEVLAAASTGRRLAK